MSDYAIETFEHEGMTVRIYQDYDAGSPKEWDQLGTMVAFDSFWRSFEAVDRRSESEEDRALGIDEYDWKRQYKHAGWEMLRRYMMLTEGAELLPYVFDDYGSNGYRLRESERDPARAAGFIYMDREDIIKEYGDDSPFSRDKARELLSGELKEWGMYFEGKVYYFTISTPDGEVVDSLGGIYDDDYYGNAEDSPRGSHVAMEALMAAETAASEYRRKRSEWIFEHVAMAYGKGIR